MPADYNLDLQAELAILESRLEWPEKELMRAYYRRLLEFPGSVIILALEAPRGAGGPQWKTAWLSSKERDAMRKAVIKANATRARKNERLTSESP